MEGLIFGMLRYGISICLAGALKKSLGHARLDLISFPFLTLATQATFIYFVYIWFVLFFCIFVS